MLPKTVSIKEQPLTCVHTGAAPGHAGLVSVVMPCFNAERFVEEAVRSTLGQSYGNVELIVVDDGSTDRSREILVHLEKEFTGRLTVLHQENQGPYPARNLGLIHAKGEFVAFLDADDYWDVDFLARLHHAIEENGADVAYCGWQNVGNVQAGIEPYVPPCYEADDLVATFLKGCPWPIHAALSRRSVIEAVGGFSERYFSSMDYDLWIRLLTATRKIVRVPEVLAFYRWHGSGQISAVKWKQVIDSWNVRRDFIRANPSLVRHLDRKALRRAVYGYLLQNAYGAYWKRDLMSARILFRKSLMTGGWQLRDLRYLLPSLLPEQLYRSLICFVDRGRGH